MITIATGDVGDNCVSPEMANFEKPRQLPHRCFVIPSKRKS